MNELLSSLKINSNDVCMVLSLKHLYGTFSSTYEQVPIDVPINEAVYLYFNNFRYYLCKLYMYDIEKFKFDNFFCSTSQLMN